MEKLRKAIWQRKGISLARIVDWVFVYLLHLMYLKIFVPLLGVVVMIGAGCTSVGPETVRSSRPAYNMAVQNTNDQELLLNLVRSRYRDTLYFTSVERIAATQELLRGVTAGGGLTETRNHFGAPATGIARSVATPLTLGGSFSVNEKPTIFYAPVEGEKFVRQMMTPMNPDLLLLLVKSGWSLDRVFSVGIAEINGLKNAPTASGPTPSREPEFRGFLEAVGLLRALQREQLLDVAKSGEGEGIELRFSERAKDRSEIKRLMELLRLNPNKTRFRLVVGSESSTGDTLTISTRPLISALNYLSQGVEVPERDYTNGKIRRTLRADGTPFDWQEMLGDVFRVQVSAKEPNPEDVSTMIHYRGAWFYIADNDLDTKSTFVLLTQLMSLHSAPASAGPALSFSFGK